MTKPKIAVLMDWYLPGTKAGGPVRSVYSLINLLRDLFDFYVITTNTDLGTTAPYKGIGPNKLFLKDGVHYYYFNHDQLNAGNMLDVLKAVKPDLIYLNSFWSFHFSISILRLKKKGMIAAPVLLAPRGMLGKGALGLKSLKKKLFLGFAGLSGWYKAVTFHATQPQEEQDIRGKFPSAKVAVAPNVNSGSVMENKSAKTVNHLRLFYLSRIAKVKNLHFALEVLKDIPGNYRIEYDLFGNIEDADYWNSCKQIIATLPENISVTYKKELQFNEVQETISGYHCLFLPTLNENFGHSIVESLLSGCPAIISDQTPWNDLEQHKAGYALKLGDKKGFVNAVISYAGAGQEEFSARSKQAIRYISDRIDLKLITDQYKRLFNDRIKN